MTSLREGVRVPKDDLRIEVNGQIDQLNAHLGVVRSMLDEAQDSASIQLIHAVQRELMTVMSHVATPDGRVNQRELRCSEMITRLEQAIDNAGYQGGFVVPGGGSQLAAFIHLARTQARAFIEERWRGIVPVAWGETLREASFTEWVYAEVLGLDDTL